MKITAKRLLLYIGGILALSIGINISKISQLGISPVSSIPYAIELIWDIELGKTTLFVYVFFIIMQMILLRKNYKPIQLLQIVFTYMFGIFITFTSTDYLLAWIPIPSHYMMKLIYLFISIIVLGIGVSLYLLPNFIPLPPEGLVNAIVELSKGKLKIADVKVAVDSALVVISALLSLVFLGGLKSVREGTVLSALLIGKVVGFIYKNYKQGLVEWMDK